MAKAAKPAEDSGLDEGPEPLVSFKLSRPWSSDRGFFPVGAVASVPESIAESLLAEGMGDLA